MPELGRGRLLRFRRADIEAFVARELERDSEPVAAPRRTYRSVGAPVVNMNDPKVQAKREELRAKREKNVALKAAQAAKANRPKAP